MKADFNFKELGKAINAQLSPGENTMTSLNSIDEGKVIPYGVLGDFSDQIDKDAQRSYIEDGFIRNIKPRNFEALLQQPDATILIKKRMFTSLLSNHKTNILNEDEKLFIKASKILFRNKCALISAYEKLSKLDLIVEETGGFNSFMLPLVFDAVDQLQNLDNINNQENNSSKKILQKLKNALGVDVTTNSFNKLKELYKFSNPAKTTTWIMDRDSSFAQEGEGTGVIEITMFSNLRTGVGLSLGEGKASFEIEDPYKLMIITNDEIDAAISESTNLFNQNNFLDITKTELSNTIQTSKSQLNEARVKRNVPGISWIVDPNTLATKTIRAIIDGYKEVLFDSNPGTLGIDGEVKINPEFLNNGIGISDKNIKVSDLRFGYLQKETKETDLFIKIIKDTYKLLKLEETTKSRIVKFNEQTNYVRKKMRLHFANKSIIQPMDSVHIYLGSKAETDKKISMAGGPNNLGANYTLSKMTQSFGNLLDNIGSYFSNSFDPYLNFEKNSIVGNDFPLWLYKILKNDFTKEGAGVHVFAGIVESSNHSYSDGKYNLSVSVNDNSSYFANSIININPSLDVFNYNLYDPVTPFNIKFDSSSGVYKANIGNIPELLSENKKLLESSTLRIPNGPSRGSIANLLSINNPEQEPAKNSFRRVINAPPGLVYRWKQGIGTLTKNGKEIDQPGFGSAGQPRLSNSPFAGQDIMNTISLLITGQPYNYVTFIRSAINSGSISRDDLNNENGASSYYRGLIDDLTKQNQIWGNFIPFKKIILNQEAFVFSASGQDSLAFDNEKLKSLLEKRAEVFDQLASLNKNFAKSPQIFNIKGNNISFTDAINNITRQRGVEDTLLTEIAKLDLTISRVKKSITSQMQTLTESGTLKVFGDDFTLSDPNISDIPSAINQEQFLEAQERLRRNLNSLTLRRSWKVRSNSDINLFIIDDTYDKNYDIQSFEQSFSSDTFKNLFASDYESVLDQIRMVSDISIGLEIYADTQGHIQVRSPQYNRMPKSVFYNMLKTKSEKGIQIFPEFLESLFLNQIDDVSNQLEIIELNIRLRAAVLGYLNDSKAQNFLSENNSSRFIFVTDEETGSISLGLKEIIKQRNVENFEENSLSLSKEASNINERVKSALNQNIVFSLAAQAEAANSSVTINPKFEGDFNGRIQKIRENIESKTHQPAPTVRDLISFDRLGSETITQKTLVKIINELSQLISQRQRLLIVMANSLSNLSEGTQLNSKEDKTSSAAVFPQIYNQKVPKILEHMIEDEDLDDLGPNSGSRYIIKDYQIKSLTINENLPDYTTVQVNGIFDPLVPNAPAGMDIGNGGSAFTSALAVDYDLWNMYGFKKSQAITAPFFTDPDSQCAPFAVYLLNMQRKKIFTASLTIVGNEYMQPGEVIYIEDRDLLFYIKKVSHSFGYNSNFETSLELEFGHNPGEYIPTPLDIIGKALYNNRFYANQFRVDRFDSANGDQYLNAIGIESNVKSGEEIFNAISNGICGDINKNNLINIINSVSKIFSPNFLNKLPKLQIRYYYNTSTGDDEEDSAKNLAKQLKTWFTDPKTYSKKTEKKELIPIENIQNLSIEAKNIEIISIDLSPSSGSSASPSHEAHNLARKIAQSNDPDDYFEILYQNIVDIVVSFTNPISTTDTVKIGKEIKDEESLDQLKAINELLNKRART